MDYRRPLLVEAKNILLILTISLLSAGCTDTPLPSSKLVIENYENKVYDFASMASDVDTAYFYLSENALPISMITKAFATDKSLYIIDASNTIHVFDVASGELLNQIRTIGHAPNEYLGADAVTGYNDSVFVLDRNQRCITTYDANLNFIQKTKLDFVPMDVLAINGGFLFSRFDVDEDKNRFLLTSRNGKVIKSFVSPNSIGDRITTTSSFAYNHSDDAVYLHEPMSKHIYKFEKGDANLFYEIDLSNKDALMQDVFVTESNVICNFLYGGRLYTCIHSIDSGETTTGGLDLNSGRPFFPMCQVADKLIGIYHTNELDELPNWETTKQNSALTMLTYQFSLPPRKNPQ